MRSGGLIERKKRLPAGAEAENRKRHPSRGPGKLSIISLGPGGADHMIPMAFETLASAEVLVGYKTYLDLIRQLTKGKKVIASGMRKEIERAQTAIEHAQLGYHVALVSSGDAGIYGMAGLVFDLCRQMNLNVSSADQESRTPLDFSIHVIPGVPAFNAAASLVGAPLMHDFAAVSLSDHLTPWDQITKRLRAVAEADFVIVLYNPRSKTRPELLEKAVRLLLRSRSAETPVALVRSAMRANEWHRLFTLGKIPYGEVNMQSVLIIGNSKTYVWNGWMVTPRGYLDKYSLG